MTDETPKDDELEQHVRTYVSLISSMPIKAAAEGDADALMEITHQLSGAATNAASEINRDQRWAGLMLALIPARMAAVRHPKGKEKLAAVLLAVVSLMPESPARELTMAEALVWIERAAADGSELCENLLVTIGGGPNITKAAALMERLI